MITTCLPCGRDRRLVEVALLHAVRPRQVLHRLVDAGELAARAPAGRATRSRRPRARPRRTRCSSSTGTFSPTFAFDAELGALGFHLRDAPVEVPLLHLELGDAVAQQPADAIGALVDGHVVTGARSCCAAASPAGPEPTTATRLPVFVSATTGATPALFPRAVDDLDLDLLDRDRRLVDAEHARGFARRRAQPAGELGEVVGRVQPLARRAASGRGTRGRSTRG